MSITEAVLDADLRVLLMCVFQITGDRRWLEPRFAPRKDARLVPPEDAGFSEEIAEEIRAAAIDAGRALIDGTIEIAISDPGDELMVEMMAHCLGQRVPAEYAPMMREELGFESRDVVWPAGAVTAEMSPSDRAEILVVGAGASGVAIGARLGRLGLGYRVVDAANSVGGVWRDNRYPGAGVDTPNHAYSYSFARPNAWTRFFAPQSELEAYIQRTSDECGVTENIEFGTRLCSATWSDRSKRWQVELDGPTGIEQREYRFLISAIGQLNIPTVPTIDGLDSFAGLAFHSSHWPDDLDVTGKHVAVIGTGASSMQIVPAIAEQVEQVTIYQRTAQWARPIPRYHDPIPAGSQWLFEHLPFYAAWFRFSMLWRYGDGLLPFLRKDPEWPHPERSVNSGNDQHRIEMAEHIVAELGDRTDLIEKCMPTYPPYGKRILLDNGWFSTLTRPNVELVDRGVERLTPTGVIDADGVERRADIVVFATGFEVFQGAARLGIVGRNGVDLAEEWADDDPTAYLGITVPGFPNFFCVQGPTTGLGHGGSAIFQAECHARHITACLAEVARADASTIEVRREPTVDYNSRHDTEHERLIWTHEGMHPWYRNAAGRVVGVMPWRLVDYWSMTHDVDLDDYVIE